ncbi:universal stress protein [Vibrio cincinnatiensis]|jgi:universal stress protein A|uniref:Universal stress protein n=1 Tax=Vibrio cincinnatiensis DSM 19608 TaxID=1123491 RepID=A0A1T4R6E7_VIBCI|nr:universal stress protein [Vibrio cincinnatiensis]MCG3722350.1 universal stress global response regulator UspA [Vibrio cincinnatiensis]MCG3734062.1 universal stress global response regulator UspA [Vibrio cincinnatiensis]MCG3735937.1 universal stress global response regulator UspA [Vibrio cincinnatiensis]MCG3740650.1 universal stress global response regulator UspA [Vibrio cincinnatiensis]MCG3744135.1 universal stress global response regulator UspA [Vibrio cincinnatiensis]
MSYQHILVAVDLSEDSKILIDKAVALAKPLNAEISFIHIDVNYAELYTGLIDINLAETQHHSMESSQKQLQELADYANHPIHHTLVGSGDFSNELCETINEFNIDLVVCGHHQDFWSKILSSTRQLINCSPVDMLVVPLND